MLITAGSAEKANAMTASWGGLGVLWGKNVAFIFVREHRYTKEFIDKEAYFSCNFFDKKFKNDLKYFGVVSGRQEDKFNVILQALPKALQYIKYGDCLLLCQSTIFL